MKFEIKFYLMSTLIWACDRNIRSKVAIYITYILRELFYGKNVEKQLRIKHIKTKFWAKKFTYDPNVIKPALDRRKCIEKVVIVLWLMFMTHRAWKTFSIFTTFDYSLRDYKITASSSAVLPARVYVEPFRQE